MMDTVLIRTHLGTPFFVVALCVKRFSISTKCKGPRLTMSCTRTGIPLRSIPAGDSHVRNNIFFKMIIIDLITLTIAGILAGTIGGLLGLGGGILIMPILRFFVGLSPAYAAGTCIVAVFFTTLGGSYRHYKQGHINIRSIIPVITAGALSTMLFSLIF